MTTPTEPRPPRPRLVLAVLAVLLAAAGCGGPVETAPPDRPSWTVTAWGEHYEVFPEAPVLSVGETAVSHTHVTRLEDFAPLVDGRVEIVLRPAAGSGGPEQSWAADAPSRPGIFPVRLTPATAGDFDLLFRISAGDGGPVEEIRGGRLRVGPAGEPGSLLRAPAPRGTADPTEPVPFLKEQQWRADFATAWVRSGSLPEGVAGPAVLRPPAGGETVITAPVDGVLRAEPWPYPGAAAGRGEVLFRLVPRVAADRSLAELDAGVTALEADLEAARARRQRLAELLELEAVSRRELEEATARVAGLEARAEAARRDRAVARDGRAGGGGGEVLPVAAPFAGRVGRVSASPGAAVAAGEPLARLVRTDRTWVEVALPPAQAAALGDADPVGLLLEMDGARSWRLPAEAVRRVAVAPEVDPDRGTVAVLLELTGSGDAAGAPLPPLGSRLEATVLLASPRRGVVIPTAALVDDGGVAVVYLQLSGERFVRQEVHVVARRGDRALVEGLVPGQRLVTRGGDAIRRTTLMSSGEAHGHVH